MLLRKTKPVRPTPSTKANLIRMAELAIARTPAVAKTMVSQT